MVTDDPTGDPPVPIESVVSGAEVVVADSTARLDLRDDLLSPDFSADCCIVVLPLLITAPPDALMTGYILARSRHCVAVGRGRLPPFVPAMRHFTVAKDAIPWLQAQCNLEKKRARARDDKRRILTAGYGLSKEGLFQAIGGSDDAVVESFLSIGLSPNLCDRDGIPILHIAIRNRHVGIAMRILAAGADPNLKATDRANSPLAEAAASRSPELVAALVEAGAEIDTLTADGQSALMIAVGEGDVDTAKILINAGASTAPTDKLGMTAIKYARLFGNTTLIKLVEGSGG